MSAPVDVLAVLDLQIQVGEAAIQSARDDNDPDLLAIELAHGVNVNRLSKCRDAVAELIEAAKFALSSGNGPAGYTDGVDRRLAEAISRVGGAS